MRQRRFGARTATATATGAVLAVGLVCASAPLSTSAAAAGPSASTRPSWLHQTVAALAYAAPAGPFVPHVEPGGTAVPGRDVTAVAPDSARLRFGLATLPASTQTYPAISADGGATWKVDGPLFHVDALQGASTVVSSGILDPDGAYFWGHGGNLIWITHDKGAQWWRVAFGAGVDELRETRGTLQAVVFGAQVHGTALQRFLYVSTDAGKTWRLRRQLADQ